MPQFSYSIIPQIPPTLEGTPGNLKALALRVPKDLAIDLDTGDVEIPIRLVSGVDAIVQRIFIRLRFFFKEWFLDQRLGIPYFERVFVKGPSLRSIRGFFEQAILTTPGVVAVVEMQLDLDKRERRLRVDGFTIRLQDGTLLQVKSGQPFIVV